MKARKRLSNDSGLSGGSLAALQNARDLCAVRRSGEEQCWQEFILYAAAASSTSGEKAARGRWNEAHCALVPKVRVDGWMGGWVDGWMDGWMDEWVRQLGAGS
jgi:hypothetical protein